MELLIRETFEIAKSSVEHGNHPFGALLADSNNNVILTAENTCLTDNDITHHAELNLCSSASKLSREVIEDCTFYCSTEPCVMCVGAIVRLKVKRVVYGCSTERMSEIAKRGSFSVPCRDNFSRSKNPITVIGPFLGNEAEIVHLEYWG